uniref:Retrovirus-related Pol polyprotein from transposon TNT 1-94-like beta-barrel domain-containing protein n=1 Tax=Tanacetum cinerariifolium TaxID=118510 RepID=A0A699LAR0_TANCI|nr:hypothetical protein [Tanacetum cinerariifolium]
MTGNKSKEQPPRANTMMISSTSAYDSKSSEPDFIPNLSTKDWAAIVNLVKTQKLGHTEKLSSKNVNYERIVESGASHHMTGCLSLLTNVQDIVPIPDELPLDIETFAVKKGTMRLTDNTFHTNVLFIPKMRCTIISIKCLMKDLNFSEQGRVFLFKEAEQGYASRVKVDDDFELWHRRL